MKTSELTGAALEWAVAKCEGATDFWFDTVATHWMNLHGRDIALKPGWAQSYSPSTDWSQGGPIIEREEVDIDYAPTERQWYAHVFTIHDDEILQHFMTKGPTPLIASMRCYVASKLGDNIDIPEELK